jgi:hypothetical protein
MGRARCVLLAIAATVALLSPAYAQIGLQYSGKTTWKAAEGIVTFDSSGSMPDGVEEFFWNVPAEVKRITIGADVKVVGGFRVMRREASNPLHIVGSDRKTSIIYGTDAQRWTAENKIAENAKWKYGAVSVLADAVVHVDNLTSENPRGYHISGYAKQAVIHVNRCNLLDTRPGNNNNSDGFVGAGGSSVRDSFISTADDGIKVYRDITIANVTIEQHRNGAPIQFGWGGESGDARATIENLTILGVDPQHRYNMAPFTWQGGTGGTRNVSVDGLVVKLRGSVYDKDAGRWQPAGLFMLNPAACTLEMKIANATISVPTTGIRRTCGTITIDGAPVP